MQLLKELREQGYEVKISHNRTFVLPAAGKFWGTRGEHPALRPEPKGGFTVATIKDGEGNYVCSATARCSERDNYSRKLGMNIALGRAASILTGEAKRRKARNGNGC